MWSASSFGFFGACVPPVSHGGLQVPAPRQDEAAASGVAGFAEAELPARAAVPPESRAESRAEATQPQQPQAVLKGADIKEATAREEPAREEPVRPPVPAEVPSPQPARPGPHELSLVPLIAPGTSPQRALSLRMTEEARGLLRNQQYEKALSRLEKAIAVDSRNPYSYYYLAEAHFRMGNHQQSLTFLDIAEPLFPGDASWSAQVLALRGSNHETLGDHGRADLSYLKALKLDPENRLALEGVTRLGGEDAPSSR